MFSTGLQAVPLSVPRSLQKTSVNFQQDTELVREPATGGFRQGTEPSRRFLLDLNTGLVQEHISEKERRTGKDLSHLGS